MFAPMHRLLLCFFLLPATLMAQETLPWYQTTTIYQIYPRSYYDSNGDGIGDLEGIIQKLDYIQATGFETIWISPFYRSPQEDFGYDVSDYYRIDPAYGDSATVERLIREVHRRDMKILFDMVLNHTSDQHPWFQQSKQDTTNPKADWYVWADGNGKKPPNNWKSSIGGPAWHYVPERDQYYYAAFLPFQPDLNYRNPEVKQAMFDVVRYWLDKGVDGFRLDLFNTMMEDPALRDNPFSTKIILEEDEGFFQKMEHTLNHPDNFTFAEELRQVLDEYDKPQRFLLGEVFGSYPEIKEYQGNGHNRLHLAFLFDMLNFKFSAGYFREKVLLREQHFPYPYMPVYVFGNHDRKRYISRIGNDVAKARVLATFQLTVRGVPVMYMGEEIGMQQASIPVKQAKDPLAKKYSWIPQFLLNMSAESINRDECRTPMQWAPEANAGFSPEGVEPWLQVNDDHDTVNVQTAKGDSHSLWHIYHDLLQLRRQHPALHKGKLQLWEGDLPRQVLACTRSYGDEQLLIVLNFGKREQQLELHTATGEVLFAVYPTKAPYTLPGYGAKIIRLNNQP